MRIRVFGIHHLSFRQGERSREGIAIGASRIPDLVNCRMVGGGVLPCGRPAKERRGTGVRPGAVSRGWFAVVPGPSSAGFPSGMMCRARAGRRGLSRLGSASEFGFPYLRVPAVHFTGQSVAVGEPRRGRPFLLATPVFVDLFDANWQDELSGFGLACGDGDEPVYFYVLARLGEDLACAPGLRRPVVRSVIRCRFSGPQLAGAYLWC